MNILEKFLKWELSIKDEIGDVTKLLNTPLSDEPEKLIRDLQIIESWNARMGALLAESNNFLDKSKHELMPSKDGRMESDRKALLDSDVAPLRTVRDTLEHYCDAIRQRLILGESILSYYKQQYPERKAPLEKIF